uniref:Uncharacterized protein n=1 Tax=Myoviridae sp. ctcPl3 TaxID=2826669 RepID=A0A8S5QVW9_9CAUD|nr:MAG TPA: hypothetical protein [Myoviridae sp. ctcPl3]
MQTPLIHNLHTARKNFNLKISSLDFRILGFMLVDIIFI